MANLVPIGSNGLLTLGADQIVDRVDDWREAMAATDGAINNAKFNGAFIPDGTDWNTLTQTKAHAVRYANTPFSNAPSTAAGTLLVFDAEHPSLEYSSQLFLAYAGAGIFYRSQGSSGSWVAWKRVDDPNKASSAAHRAALVGAYKARRGGVLGCFNRIALSLRFDHGLANFETKVLPLLRKYNLPWSQAINSRQLADTANASSFTEVSGWCVNDGGEVWNHGGDHISVSGESAVFDQIVTALTELKNGMPALAIEGWAPPGLAAGGLDGYAPMDTLEQHWNTYAGQLVLAYHAAVSGYLPGLYRPLPADMQIGFGHATMDAQTPSWVDGVIRGAIETRMGLQFMLHPVYLDTTGYMTTAQLEEVFANIANRRDNGEIEVLTPSGMLLADPGSTHRDNLISNGGFRNGFTGWGNTTGWAVNTAGATPYATTTTGTPLTQTVGMARREALLGGARELIYRVRATSGAVVRTAATGTGVNATKDHTLPASTSWVQVRKPLVIPRNFTGDLTAAVGRVSGGAVDITDIRLRSI